MNKGLYIHIPFCNDICGYCDFVRVGYHTTLVDNYLMQLRQDIAKLNDSFDTVYIGGGTPSSLSTQQLTLLLDSLKSIINTASEVTIEANPESLSVEKIKLLKDFGVKRVSLGLQSTQDYQLKAIGRLHTFSQAKDVIRKLKEEGISNISVDLIYGLPNQTIDELNSDLDAVIDLDLPHISIYALTIEPHSAFGRQNIKPVDQQIETDMYLLIQEKLTYAGYLHYEISNYAKEGYQSKHNLHYWKYDDFIGLGIGAASKFNHQRTVNRGNIHHYNLGQRNFQEVIELSPKDEAFETLMMGLRLEEGINLDEYYNQHHIDLLKEYKSIIRKHVDSELLEVTDNKLKATNNGRLMLNDILVDFLD